MEREIKISNDLNEISVLASFIEELGEELSLSFETTMNINLALEEAVANIIMYAYPTQEQHTILLRVTYSEKQLVFLLTDKGASFDPTQVDEVDVTLSLEERPIGGLGIFLILGKCVDLRHAVLTLGNHSYNNIWLRTNLNGLSYRILTSENILRSIGIYKSNFAKAVIILLHKTSS